MDAESVKEGRILIVDDEEWNVDLLDRILQRAGYTHIRSTTDSRCALPLCLEFQPDLILLDLNMPYVDGFGVMEQVGACISPGTYLPILILTADSTPETRLRALSGGAKDFLTKPFDRAEVLLRIKNLLETRFLHCQIQNQNQLLEQKVSERTRKLEDAQVEILERLALAAEYRDDATGEHTQRVGQIAALVARALGLSEEQVELIRRSAPLHDVGKIGVPDLILLKPGKLTAPEFEVMKMHTTIGARILSGSQFPLLRAAEEIALTHHERWDGSGYPRGLRRDTIPLEGRIVAVADVFDALTHDRPYKKAWPVKRAVAELVRRKGKQFDPRVIEAFVWALEHDGLLTATESIAGSRLLVLPSGEMPTEAPAAERHVLTPEAPSPGTAVDRGSA